MLYDYKSDEIVQDFIFDDLSPLIDDIEYEFYNLRRHNVITIYAFSDIAIEILAKILERVDWVWIHPDSDNESLYKDNSKVLISIGYDGCIIVENAIGEKGQIKVDDDDVIKYVHDSFSTKDIDRLTENGDSILVFGLKDDSVEKENACKKCGCDGKNHNSTELFVNGRKVTDHKEIQEWIKEYREINKKVDEIMNSMWLL